MVAGDESDREIDSKPRWDSRFSFYSSQSTLSNWNRGDNEEILTSGKGYPTAVEAAAAADSRQETQPGHFCPFSRLGEIEI
ncbi:unnamed protein product [Linum tenue]|uniref:Uncharacterized protein n=1 Tax=Linum tenue TaxID=586396 RepID=A0AAV0LBT3_9ROSI|nr:unnamed protein product [Linum tenue]